MKVAILAHEKFPEWAKTAVGVLRYGDQDVVAVIDRERAGTRVADHVPDAQDAPIVESMAEAPACDELIIGIAPVGGDFEESWRPDVRTAIQRGCDVVAGLHYFLADDEEFADLAEEHGVELRDVRRPPDDLTVADGVARDVDAEVVLTVGTDSSIGKMTTTMELVEAARQQGVNAAAVPTGQTGIVIEGWGIAVDHVIADYTAGAVERMILEAAPDHDLLVVEGQGSIVHPAYSGVTCSILHGAMPDRLVLCHAAGREVVHSSEAFSLPPLAEYVDLYEKLAAPLHETSVAAGALNTTDVPEDAAARAAVEYFADEIEAPATDPVRFGVDEVLEAIL